MTDVAASTKTTAALETTVTPFNGELVGTYSGRLESEGDHDWIRVQLFSGKTYFFYLSEDESAGVGGLAATPAFSIRASTGQEVANATGGGVGTNTATSFFFTATGTYYIDVSANSRGAYSLFVTDSTLGTNQSGSTSDDSFGASTANARLLGGLGEDFLDLGTLGHMALGEQGRDTLLGTGAADVLSGGLGHDLIDGKGGQDVIFGDAGDDQINGGTGSDQIFGGDGFDNLFGSDGDDRLAGGVDDDVLGGGADSDTLIGGAGRDVLFGGSEKDLFVFNSTTDSTRVNRDSIMDFSHAETDRIDLHVIDAKKGHGNQAFTFIGTQKFHHKAGELHFVKHGTQFVTVEGDTNGDGRADFAIDVHNTTNNLHSLGQADFIL